MGNNLSSAGFAVKNSKKSKLLMKKQAAYHS